MNFEGAKNAFRMTSMLAAASIASTAHSEPTTDSTTNLNTEAFPLQGVRHTFGLDVPTTLNYRDVLDRLPNKRIELGFGQSTRLTFSPEKTDLTFSSGRLNFGYERLDKENRSTLSLYRLGYADNRATGGFGFNGFRASDESGTVDTQKIEFSGKEFGLRASRIAVDAQFNRFAELGIADPERKFLESERGNERTDIALRFNPTRGMSINSERFRSDGLENDVTRTGYRDSLTLGSLSYIREGTEVVNGGSLIERNSHDRFSLQHAGKGFAIQGAHDVVRVERPLMQSSVSTQSMGLQLQGRIPLQARFENKETTINNISERSTMYDVATQPFKGVQLHALMHTIDRERGESSTRTIFDWALPLGKTFNFSGVSHTFRSDSGNSERGLQARLQGSVDRFTVNAFYDDREGDLFGDLNSTQITWGMHTPFSFGKDALLSFSGVYADISRNGEIENKSSSVSARFSTRQLQIAGDLSHATLPDGREHIEQTVAVAVNQKNLQGNLKYTKRDSDIVDVDTSLSAGLRYSFSPTSSLIFNYTHRPVNERNQVLPVSMYDLTYAMQSRDGLAWKASLGSHYNYDADFRSTRFELGVAGKLHNGGTLSAQLGGILEERRGSIVPFGIFGLTYDRKVNEQNFITLAAQYQRQPHPGLGNWTLNLNWKYRF